MSNKNSAYEKRLINFIPGDIDTIKAHFPDVSYNGVIRTVINAYAEGLRTGKVKPIGYDPNNIKI